MNTTVKITPISQRAKNRVNEHGEIMILEEEGMFNGVKAIRVRSIKETWGSAGRKQNWAGWFDINECSWEVM